MMFAQTGADSVITAAQETGHWESVGLGFLLVTLCGLVVWVMRQQQIRLDAVANESNERENRLANRVTALEEKLETKLITMAQSVTTALGDNTQALVKFSAVLDTQQTLCGKHAELIGEHTTVIKEFEQLERGTATCLQQVIDALNDSTSILGVHRTLGEIATAKLIEVDARTDIDEAAKEKIREHIRRAIERAQRVADRRAD